MTDGGDPSTRTIEQLRMSTAHASELTDAKFESLETQLRERDKAIQLLQDRINRQPTPDVLEQQIIALGENFKIQIEALYKYMEAIAASNKESLSLALTSQQDQAKETKDALQKQIESMKVRQDDGREQVARMEYADKGAKQNNASTISIAAVVISFIGVLAVIIINIVGRSG